MTNPTKNGIMPVSTSGSLMSFLSAIRAKRLTPNGGVRHPISMLTTMMMQYQIRSIWSAFRMGRMIGKIMRTGNDADLIRQHDFKSSDELRDYLRVRITEGESE